MRVKALAVRDPDKAWDLVRSCPVLLDAAGWLSPSEFWRPGAFPAARRRVKLYVLAMRPKGGGDEETARAAAGLLERRSGLVLDWAAGVRKSGNIWLFIKPLARCARSGKARAWRPGPGDLEALREMR